jgi:hypothetical protein
MRVVKTVVLALGCLAWLTAPARAQGEGAVHGQVVAAADASALALAAVTLRSAVSGETVQTTMADASGRFVFTGLRADQYVVSASFDGFRTRDVRLILEPREVRGLTLLLDVAGPEVSVEVSAGVTLPSTHSPSSSTLTADRVEALPVFQRTGLTDAIVTSAPGMIRGHDDFVHVRGHEIALNPSINGVSFWENPHAVFSAGFSPDVIEVANIMTGGFSAEYGNRFGGVIDVVTKSGLSMQNEASLAFSAGEAGRRTAFGDFGGRRGRFGYYVFGSAFESDRFLSPPDPEAIHDSARVDTRSCNSTGISAAPARCGQC